MDVDQSSLDASPSAPEHIRLWPAVTRTLAFLSRNPLVLAVMTAVVFVPVLLYELNFLERARTGMSASEFKASRMGLIGIYGLLTLLLQAATTLAVFQHLRRDRVRPLASIRRGLLSFVPIVVTAVLLMFFWGAANICVSMPVNMLLADGDDPSVLKTVNLVLSLGVLVWIGSVHLVAAQALVVERLSPAAAITRSRILTGGSRWRIAGFLVMVFIARWLITLGLYPTVIDPSGSWADYKLARGVDAAINSLFAAFIAACGVVIYSELRRIKDGIDVDDLIEVFD